MLYRMYVSWKGEGEGGSSVECVNAQLRPLIHQSTQADQRGLLSGFHAHAHASSALPPSVVVQSVFLPRPRVDAYLSA